MLASFVIGFHVTGAHPQLWSTSGWKCVVTHLELVNPSEPSVYCRMLYLGVWFVTCAIVFRDSLTTSQLATKVRNSLFVGVVHRKRCLLVMRPN